MMTVLECLSRLFVVHKCAACKEILDVQSFDGALCKDCAKALEIARIESCPDCFKSILECRCQPKALENGGSLCLRKLFIYHKEDAKEPQNRLIYFMKKNTSHRAFGYVANEIWRGVSEELLSHGYTAPFENCVLTNVPRGRRAVIRYGFDQSQEVCEAIGELTGISYRPLLKRKFGSREQKKLNAAERKKNMKSVIYANEKLKSSVEGKCVILFDDIVTTGASMSACLPILRKMGAKDVICCTLAVDLKNKSLR